MARLLFNEDQFYLLGAHKGKHVSELPLSFVQWASVNVDGFREQYNILANGGSLPGPAKVKAQAFSQKPPGRKYFVSKIKRLYEPTKPTTGEGKTAGNHPHPQAQDGEPGKPGEKNQERTEEAADGREGL